MSPRIDISQQRRIWIWYARLDRRNGHLAWGPVGTPFDRSKLKHWVIAAVALWKGGRR